MTKKNVIDLSKYNVTGNGMRNEVNEISDELKEAIQNLILRLRESDPLPPSTHRYAAQINKKAR